MELEAEKQRLDDELTRAQKKISVSEKAITPLTIIEPVNIQHLKTINRINSIYNDSQINYIRTNNI